MVGRPCKPDSVEVEPISSSTGRHRLQESECILELRHDHVFGILKTVVSASNELNIGGSVANELHLDMVEWYFRFKIKKVIIELHLET